MCSALIYRWICIAVLLGHSWAASVTYDNNRPASQLRPDNLENINVPSEVIKTKDELRCHCNLPVCVTTGYMCKSAMGMCFSEIVDRSDLSKSRHGCLELLSSDKIEACHNQPPSDKQSTHRHLDSQRPLVLCCQDDLCNLSAQQVQLRFNSAVRNQNDSSVGGLEFRTVAMETRFYGDINAGSSHVTTKDLWLKAATIAVPIAGGFILVLLVFLAIRMLRRDRENGLDYLPTEGNDFQIRCVWGNQTKSRLQQQQQQMMQQQHPSNNPKWKDRQPMLSGNGQTAIQTKFAQHNIVYLPTVHKSMSQKKIWSKKDHNLFPNGRALDHV